MTGELVVRNCRPDELDVIKSITVQAFDGVSIDRNMEFKFGAINGRDWQWRKARHIDEDLRRDPNGVFVAEAGEEVVGYITTYCDQESGIGFIPNLAVDQRHRGKGIGRMLIEYALDHMRKKGMSHARIETLEQNRIGQQLYPSLGFKEIARQIHYGMRLCDAGEE